jgi:hypothetical protein
MISQRQQEANRRNAAKSHGPTTPEGRAAVRHNALKHGFTAAEIILPPPPPTTQSETARIPRPPTLQLAKRPIFRHYEVRMCGTLA